MLFPGKLQSPNSLSRLSLSLSSRGVFESAVILLNTNIYIYHHYFNCNSPTTLHLPLLSPSLSFEHRCVHIHHRNLTFCFYTAVLCKSCWWCCSFFFFLMQMATAGFIKPTSSYHQFDREGNRGTTNGKQLTSKQMANKGQLQLQLPTTNTLLTDGHRSRLWSPLFVHTCWEEEERASRTNCSAPTFLGAAAAAATAFHLHLLPLRQSSSSERANLRVSAFFCLLYNCTNK